MATATYEIRTRYDHSAETVFGWHERPGAFERLSPPWEPAKVVERHGGITDGSRVVLTTPLGPLRSRWEIEHQGYQAGVEFSDVMQSGPFAHWVHRHRVDPDGPSAAWLTDAIEYGLPVHQVAAPLVGGMVRQRIAAVFAYRHRLLADDLALHAAWAAQPRRRVLVTGAGGLMGAALTALLTTGGHEVVALRRRGVAAPGSIVWDPSQDSGDPSALAGFDAVVHLAGEPIASGRWTAEKKAAIMSSRRDGTRALASALASLDQPPAVMVCASAVGYYGDQGDSATELAEAAPAGDDFLARVCQAWEAACEPLAEAGSRVVNARFGIVLSPAGGALAKMLPLFRIGAGGPLGSGRQQMSWIGIHDAVGALYHAICSDQVTGPMNVTAPLPVTNAEFTQTLAEVLRRPAVFPAPAAGLRLALGEMADALLLSGVRAVPGQLLSTGYRFRHPDLASALRHLLGREA